MKKIIIGVCLLSVIGLSAFTVANNDKLYEISKNIEIFVKVYQELNFGYVDDLEPSELMRTGIDAMMESLDPYTNYISESQVTAYRIDSDGKYDGIGAITKPIGDYITIVEPYEGSPAFKAGIRAGDQIIAVNGESAKGRSTSELNKIVRGFPGTELLLTIQKPRASSTETVTIIRGSVDIPNVPYSGIVGDHIGYVALSTFTVSAGANVAKAIKKMKKEDDQLKGVILDLRNNGGGLLREAISLSNLFVNIGEPIVSTKGKVIDRDEVFKTMAQPLDLEIPLVVLINKRSASASEIVSGTIQDLDRGVVIGQRSYGKGLVQNTKDVGYNSRIKLTTSKYYIPSGRCIQGVEYENGEPKDIPDHQRSTFYTRNKRPVLDGGGVTPDIKLPVKDKAAIVKSLVDDNHIFNYVSNYVLKYDSIAPVGEYQFTDITDFKQYLDENKFDYKTATEEQIDELKESAEKEKFSDIVKSSISEMEAKIKVEKSKDFTTNKDKIVDLIEKEIVTRYYFQSGKAQQSLSDDNEIIEAKRILLDTAEYNRILGK